MAAESEGHSRPLCTHEGVHPTCPVCGEGMHLFKKRSRFSVLRCPRYTECRTYFKEPLTQHS